LGAPPSLKNVNHTRTSHFIKKNSKTLSPEEPRENVSPGPAVVLNGPEVNDAYEPI